MLTRSPSERQRSFCFDRIEGRGQIAANGNPPSLNTLHSLISNDIDLLNPTGDELVAKLQMQVTCPHSLYQEHSAPRFLIKIGYLIWGPIPQVQR